MAIMRLIAHKVKQSMPIIQNGFTLIEILVFIVVSGLLMSTILIGAIFSLKNSPTIHQQWIAIQTARQCMEWFLTQKRFNGYASLSCPSTPSGILCTAPSEYSIQTNISCTAWNSDPNYKTISITVSGLANASLSAQIGDF